MSEEERKRSGPLTVGRGLAPFAIGFVTLYLLPAGLAPQAQWALAITAGTLTAWILQPVPLTAISVPIIFVLGASGTVSPEGAVAGFGSSATLLMATGFMMAAAI